MLTGAGAEELKAREKERALLLAPFTQLTQLRNHSPTTPRLLARSMDPPFQPEPHVRRSSLVLTAVIAASLGIGRPAAAQRDRMLVNTAWLTKHLKDPNLVLLHVG